MNTKILLMLLIATFFYSCNDEVLKTTETSAQTFGVIEPITDGVYPYSLFAKTRSTTIPNWEEWEKVRLSSGAIATDSVAVPWADEALVITTIPTQVRKDIKKENGWMLVKYTINGNWGKDNNYMFFYNKYTGILKVFYYLESTVESSTGIWQLKIDVPQKLLAFTGELADPINGIYQRQELYCTNITSTGTTGFIHGWNCFQIELAYDPLFTTGTLIINPINRTSSQIKLTGSYGSSSKGTLVTTTTTNSVNGTMDGLAKAAGEDAFNFIKKEVQDNKFADFVSKNIGNIAHVGVSGLVKGGVNLLFSSFTGRFNKESIQNYDLQFTTNGKAEMSGTITTETTGGLAPASLNLSKSSLGVSLGVWNLAEQTVIYFDTTAKLLTWEERKFPIYHLWKMNGGKMDNTSYEYNFVINPDITQELASYNTCIDAFTFYNDSLPTETQYYSHGDIARENTSLAGIINANGEYLYEGYNRVTDFYNKFKVYFPNHTDQSSLQRIIFLPKGNIENVTANVGVRYNMLIKASTKLYVNNSVNDTVIITKTFAPKLEWDPSLYQQNKDLYMEPYTILQDPVQ
ncbi:MAG: hypothetical protein KH897_10270 [Bacteroides sp.]|uniref:hypothetical protein n=1 Tax=Bacteroides sp. TaxID=29523 RepID=UPI0025BC0CDE|nr:hypothetical protein [Bacteroides sp.]MBS6238733.1 hypothetical protein [Bacteroides sp.]